MRNKKNTRNIWIIVVVALFIFLYGEAYIPSMRQNRTIMQQYGELFAGIRDQNTMIVKGAFPLYPMPPAYFPHLFKYKLLGWKFTGITGQPWPLDMVNHELFADVIFYYQIPKTPSPVLAKYPTITHPLYGQCIAMPYHLAMTIDANNHAYISPPDMRNGHYWMAPYEGRDQ